MPNTLAALVALNVAGASFKARETRLPCVLDAALTQVVCALTAQYLLKQVSRAFVDGRRGKPPDTLPARGRASDSWGCQRESAPPNRASLIVEML